MRRSVIALLVLAALAAGVLAGAFAALQGQRDQVVLQTQTLAGDVSAAEGLRVRLPVRCADQLAWESVFSPAHPEDLDTSFTFSPIPRSDDIPYYVPAPLQVDMLSWSVYSYYNPQEQLKDTRWAPLVEDAASNTGAGESHTQRMTLSDYMDVLPLEVSVSAPGSPLEALDAQALDALFRDYFPIPLAEDFSLEITVVKDPDGAVDMVTIGAASESNTCWFRIESRSVQAGEDILFVFTDPTCYHTDTQETTLLDDSAIPGGWGLYRLSASASGQPRLETVFSLPEGGVALDFWGSEDGSELFLLSREEGMLHLRVFDAGAALVDDVVLMDLAEEEVYWQVYRGEDFLVPMTYGSPSGYRFAVAAREAEGWALAFTGDTAGQRALGLRGFTNLDSYWTALSMDYADGRLAVRDSLDGWSTDFYLAVYTADGLAYLGSYASSLSSAVSGTDGPFSFAPCQLPQYDPEPMVAWEG